jgi:hypothetical protein
MTDEDAMVFAVASHLGMTVEEMTAKMSVQEFRGWVMYLSSQNSPQMSGKGR